MMGARLDSLCVEPQPLKDVNCAPAHQCTHLSVWPICQPQNWSHRISQLQSSAPWFASSSESSSPRAAWPLRFPLRAAAAHATELPYLGVVQERHEGRTAAACRSPLEHCGLRHSSSTAEGVIWMRSTYGHGCQATALTAAGSRDDAC